MLGSLTASSHEEEESMLTPSDPPTTLLQLPHPPFLGGAASVGTFKFISPPALHLRQLLFRAAELLSLPDYPAAHRLLSFLSSATSPLSDSSTDRLLHQFTSALSRTIPITATTATATITAEYEETLIQSSYLSLNQITPFLRFGHLTANQAILEAVQGHRALHVIDFDIMYGVQWPPFMQALAALRPPPALRITGTGHDLSLLRRTGDRLLLFAETLGLDFRFRPLLLRTTADLLSALDALLLAPPPGPEEEEEGEPEAVAVNLVFFLHKLLDEDDRYVYHFLAKLKALRPRVVTVAEREAEHHRAHFLARFAAALDHYAAIFESLEATVPPSSEERAAVERVWLGREIAAVLGENGGGGSGGRGRVRRVRHQRYGAWEATMRAAGFRNVPLSGYALSQARLLLRLHYPSEGYRLQFLKEAVFLLGWQNRPLFSVSSWR